MARDVHRMLAVCMWLLAYPFANNGNGSQHPTRRLTGTDIPTRNGGAMMSLLYMQKCFHGVQKPSPHREYVQKQHPSVVKCCSRNVHAGVKCFYGKLYRWNWFSFSTPLNSTLRACDATITNIFAPNLNLHSITGNG